MTQDEIIEMARHAGLIAPSAILQEGRTHDRAIEAFAKLVAEREREACAKVCDDHCSWTGMALAPTIRSRGQI
jgi:hypothetical protein